MKMSCFKKMTALELEDFIEKVNNECSNNEAEFSMVAAKKLMELDYSLHCALAFKNSKIIEYMLDKGYDVNQRDIEESTPLHEAVINEDLDNVKLLINRGAHVNARGFLWETPLQCLIDYLPEDLEIFEFLLDHGAKLEIESLAYFFQTSDNQKAIIALVNYNLDLIKEGWYGDYILTALVGNSNFDPVDTLRSHNLVPDKSRNCGGTILMRAASAANTNTIEYLLEQGVDVNLVNFYEFFKIFWNSSRTKRYVKCIELLLQYGVDVQYKFCKGVLQNVLRYGRFALIEPYLAHLVLIEDLGVKIGEDIYAYINSERIISKYFYFCKQEIEKLKGTVVYNSVTFFRLLAVSKQKLVKYVQNDELVSKLKVILYNDESPDLYYYNVLRRKMEKAVYAVKLREIAFDIMSEKLENNSLVIEKIVDYLNIDELETMSRV